MVILVPIYINALLGILCLCDFFSFFRLSYNKIEQSYFEPETSIIERKVNLKPTYNVQPPVFCFAFFQFVFCYFTDLCYVPTSITSTRLVLLTNLTCMTS